ncbi:MAG TPA: hypothetical protein VOA64_18645 [Candidatus Dormibacteraeota bacterium]|nr:hypothetical protein [Candidatus Dormibacteraeota bacterium]
MRSPPRKLTTHQKAVLIQVLLAFPDQKVSVCYSRDTLDCAQDFVTIFKAIGWDVNDSVSSEAASEHCAGLSLIVGANSKLPPSVEALRDALRIYEIEAEIFFHPEHNNEPDAFVFSIR